MTVLSYLGGLASKLHLAGDDDETAKIHRSLGTLQSRINAHFGDNLNAHFVFGSYTRGTILPRKADNNSDIDYMLIFKNPLGYKPQTFLSQIRAFANAKYKRSDIYQDHPTIVLELNHIKFELVPARIDFWGEINIPSRKSEFTEWKTTDPNGFNSKLTNANTNNASQIKPLVRLMKYWNAQNGYLYSSYELENWIAEGWYWGCTNLKEYLFNRIEWLPWGLFDPKYKINRINRARKIIADVIHYERNNMPAMAEAEIKKLLPEL